mmetsp:Transcript_145635/g.405839  ORF Transcript_145635/g.405839 Transcript_145635/m.405839 type:complete len:162 (-) Transcript_145635:112-597(-)
MPVSCCCCGLEGLACFGAGALAASLGAPQEASADGLRQLRGPTPDGEFPMGTMCVVLRPCDASHVQIQLWIGVDTRHVPPSDWWGDHRIVVPKERVWSPSYSKGCQVQILDSSVAAHGTCGVVTDAYLKDGEGRVLVRPTGGSDDVDLGSHQVIRKAQILA